MRPKFRFDSIKDADEISKILDSVTGRIVARVLQGMSEERVDSGETASFTRQLEYIKQQTYDKLYVELKFRTLIPVDSSIPTGAESYTWRSWDWAGAAKIMTSYADDLPKVEIQGTEVTQTIKGIAQSYSYSIQDIRAAQMAGMPLDAKKASAARRSVENTFESIAAIGNTVNNLPGFTNNATVPILTAGSGGFTGAWATATPAQMLADLHLMANTVVNQSNDVHKPNTLVLPIAAYQLIATTAFSAINGDTVLTIFLRNSPYIKQVEMWYPLATAGAAGVTRGVAYQKDPDILGFVIPQEFEQLPPQPENLGFTVPCHARCGGVSWHYPYGAVYADGI